MPTNYKVLGQSNPSATTATTLYTVPAATQTVVSTISVTNLAGTATTYRIAVRVAGATLANSQYIAYDTALPANSNHAYTIGMTLNATDVITIYAGNANINFTAFGSEIS